LVQLIHKTLDVVFVYVCDFGLPLYKQTQLCRWAQWFNETARNHWIARSLSVKL